MDLNSIVKEYSGLYDFEQISDIAETHGCIVMLAKDNDWLLIGGVHDEGCELVYSDGVCKEDAITWFHTCSVANKFSFTAKIKEGFESYLDADFEHIATDIKFGTTLPSRIITFDPNIFRTTILQKTNMYDTKISKELYKNAKAKGFPCQECNCTCGNSPDCVCTELSPFQSTLQSWLRNDKGYDIDLDRCYYDGETSNWNFRIYLLIPEKGGSYIQYDYHSAVAQHTDVRLYSYEEALETALVKAIELLEI